MYCFKCGKKLPMRVVNCPDCDTPQKRRQRYRSRMILGLFIFLAGAVTGSLFDTVFFKGQAWQHSFLGIFSDITDSSATASTSVVVEPLPGSALELSATATFSAASIETSASKTENQTAAAIVTTVDAAARAPHTETASATAVQQASSAIAAPPEVLPVSQASSTETAVLGSETMQPAPALAPGVFPAGRLVYKKTDTLEKGSGSNFHGFMARDGSELIFASNRQNVDGKPTYQCFVKQPSADSAPEKAFSWPGNVWTPETTPDNGMVVFSSDSTRPEHIFVYDRRTRNSMPLTTGTSKNMMPAVSPDGRWIAFVSDRKGSNDIWMIGLEGANLMQITSGKADDREPRWAVDGKAILFTRIIEPLKKSQILKIQLEPLGEPEILVDTPHRNWLADLSPDGTQLAFTRSESTDGSKNVLVLRELSSGKEEVIRPLNNAECFRPVWNADCQGFVFHSSGQQGKSLYQARFIRENN